MKMKNFKLLYCLAIIPFLGFLISLFGSWLKIYQETKSRKYVLIHYLILLIPMCAAGAIIVFVYFLIFGQSILARTIILLIVSAIALYIPAYLSVYISKKIVSSFNENLIK